MLCDDLDRRDGVEGWGGRSKREETHVYIQLIHFIVQQKLTEHCKAIILQLKKEKENNWCEHCIPSISSCTKEPTVFFSHDPSSSLHAYMHIFAHRHTEFIFQTHWGRRLERLKRRRGFEHLKGRETSHQLEESEDSSEIGGKVRCQGLNQRQWPGWVGLGNGFGGAGWMLAVTGGGTRGLSLWLSQGIRTGIPAKGQDHSWQGHCEGKRTKVAMGKPWSKDPILPGLGFYVSPGLIYDLIE